ncbi:MAG TPA: DNA polymerase III subunit delta [Pirellulales bacterium]|nr:DNA polymerase III subunit delta [Pirellulales bacterium]
MPTEHALDYLAAKKRAAVPAVVVAFGDEPFLSRLVLRELRRVVLDGDDGDFSLTVLNGSQSQWRDVVDELSTVALFGGGRRLVIVEEADEFVSRNRPHLEDYVARPKSGGVLVLDVKSWPSNTRLYKAADASGLQLDCNAPAEAKLLKWLVAWAREHYDVKLDRSAAEDLLEIIGPELGLLDQELAKLASSAAPGGEVTPELVQELVNGGRTKTTWEMLDAAVAGQAGEALGQLDRLLTSGENAVGLLAQVGSTLRRFAAATRAIEQAEADGHRAALRPALEAAGFKPFVLSKAESQLKQLGRGRAGNLYRWLLEADLALKGTSSSATRSRIVLEQLISRLSTAADPRNAARAN